MVREELGVNEAALKEGDPVARVSLKGVSFITCSCAWLC
jgi:hypothetical protein